MIIYILIVISRQWYVATNLLLLQIQNWSRQVADLSNQILSLNCFVLGSDPDRIFYCRNSKKNKNILNDLVIKSKQAPHLDHIAASHLDLWKVDFSSDKFPIQSCQLSKKNNIDFRKMMMELYKWWTSPCYSKGIRRYVTTKILSQKLGRHNSYLLIDQILSLNCCILGDDPNREFTVEIARIKNVSILKDLIKEKKGSRLKDVDASDINFWNALLSNRESNLSPGMLLLDVFPSGVDNYSLHITIRVPVASECYNRLVVCGGMILLIISLV